MAIQASELKLEVVPADEVTSRTGPREGAWVQPAIAAIEAQAAADDSFILIFSESYGEDAVDEEEFELEGSRARQRMSTRGATLRKGGERRGIKIQATTKVDRETATASLLARAVAPDA